MSDIQAPVDPRGTASYRAAKLAVIVLSALIILALVGLVTGVALQMTGRGTRASGSGGSGVAFVLPPGARIVATDNQPGRLILHVRTAAADEIDIVDTNDGHLVARIAAAPPGR